MKQPRFPLTKREFLAYLQGQPPERVFWSRDGCQCPLASALTEVRLLPHVSVCEDGEVWWDDSPQCQMPQWAQRFIDRIDRMGEGFMGGPAKLTVAEVLPVLEAL